MSIPDIIRKLAELAERPCFILMTDVITTQADFAVTCRTLGIKKQDVSCVRWQRVIGQIDAIGCIIEFTSKEARKKMTAHLGRRKSAMTRQSRKS